MPSRRRRVAEQRQTITDVRVLAALAHPVRWRILGHLLELGPSTATECASSAGVSPSACSYHLRHLERFGLVERANDVAGRAVDGRDRPWRALATGYSLAPEPSTHDVVTRTAQLGIIGQSIASNAELASSFLAAALDEPAEWQDAAEFASYGLLIDADELQALQKAVDALLRPLIAATRDGPPPAARVVHITFQAFPRPTPTGRS